MNQKLDTKTGKEHADAPQGAAQSSAALPRPDLNRNGDASPGQSPLASGGELMNAVENTDLLRVRADEALKIEDSRPDVDEFDPELAEIEALKGEVFDERYRIIDELARGGMGIVFRAQHLALNRPVVIKVLKAAQIGSSTAKQRFEREARRACQLDHPNIVTVHDFGYHGDLGYLVMEYVDGLTLYDYLKKYGPFSFPKFAPVAAAVLSGLSEAHNQGIIHRDIKASNIMLTFERDRLRRVKILDFGLAKVEGVEEDDVTKKSNLVGTMGAMPPERILCKPTDCRVDLYAFGVCAYRMIAGRRPFMGDDMHVLYQHVHELPPPLTEMLPQGSEYPIMVLEWVHRLLAKNPDDRPRDAGQAREWLMETMADKSIFRIDESHEVWLQQESAAAAAASLSGTFEVTDPSWSITSSPSGSYRSLVSGTEGEEQAAEVVAQLRHQENARVQRRRAVPRIALGAGVLALAGLVAVGAVEVLTPAAGKDAPTTTTSEAARATQVVEPIANTSVGVEQVFARIEADLEKGAYGTAENLLNSVRDRISTNADYQVRAAEYQSRIDIDKHLRRARQAEAALHIEDAMARYDAVLSLDAGNEEALKRHADLASKVVVKVTSDPRAEVLLDGKSVGHTPLEMLVPSNFSRVEAVADGYETWRTSLIPDGGTRVELSADLEPKSRARAGRSDPKKTGNRGADAKTSPDDGISNESLMKMD